MRQGILFISDSRESLPVAWKLMREGLMVDIYIHTPAYRQNFGGMLPNISIGELTKALKRCDTVVFDINESNHKKPHDLALLTKFGCPTSSPDVFGPISDKLRKTHRVIGGGKEMYDIEMNREKGFDLAKKLGFDIPPYESFMSLQAGIKFLQGPGKGKKWYFKPFNNAGLDLTYGDQADKLADFLNVVLPQRREIKDNIKFLLQEAVGDGVEVSNELWITNGVFKNPNRTLEQKKLMDGDLSVATGSQSNVVWRSDISAPIFDMMDTPILRNYIGKDFKGPIDANTIVTEDGKIYFLEWTPRLGYSALYLFLTFVPKGQLSSFFLNDFDAVFKDGYVSSQLISVYPYPADNKKMLDEQAKGMWIDNKPWHLADMWWQDVSLHDDGKLRCDAVDGMIGVMCNHAESLEDSITGLYRKIDQLNISSNKQYRTKADMQELVKRHNTLKRWGIT